MKVYTTDKIRNVVLLGHGGAGKTTLAEAMCHLTGVTNRMGKVEDGNSISDFTKEEQKRFLHQDISDSCRMEELQDQHSGHTRIFRFCR